MFVHGLLVDSRLWDGVAEGLAGEFRCIAARLADGLTRAGDGSRGRPLPRRPRGPIAEFIGQLGLDRATIVGNDSGGAISQILVTRHPERIERLVLTNCDMFDHFPPFPFTLMAPVAKLPGGMKLLQAPFRVGPIARFTYRTLAQKEIPPALVDAWLRPAAADAGVAADTRKLIVSAHKGLTIEAAERLRGFDRPALLTWGVNDRFFELGYARRLAAQMGDARVVEIEDAKTFVPLDQPRRVAEEIAAFIGETATVKV